MPTNSQKTNIIARLPEMQIPSIENENSEKYWKKRWNRPRRCRVLAVGERHFVVGVFVQLVVHVAEGVNMDARRDQRHHAKHRHGERVDVVADREFQIAELAERVPIAGVVRRMAVVVLGMRFACMFAFRRACSPACFTMLGSFRMLHHAADEPATKRRTSRTQLSTNPVTIATDRDVARQYFCVA